MAIDQQTHVPSTYSAFSGRLIRYVSHEKQIYCTVYKESLERCSAEPKGDTALLRFFTHARHRKLDVKTEGARVMAVMMNVHNGHALAVCFAVQVTSGASLILRS